ncbi:MAG: 23S rRNA (pseudouridine(1915)-N(3))-methyltransferase RlmH [Deltaproteobacteria bacterium]|nr:23S rRNA (pseudouridine(1915)-N(3))-methyltransferase RlmH [Deltaproteobacteria bacterium]
MKLRLISIGKRSAGPFEAATALYAKRLKHYLSLELVELPASRKREPGVAMREEGERILAALGKARLVALDAEGQSHDSVAFARRLEAWRREGRDVILVIGGDEGLSPEVKAAADELLALGPMTLPHRLAKVVLLEQLYRAATILKGEPYHK